jgi:D-lactate dehydrogenase (cytochrome)
VTGSGEQLREALVAVLGSEVRVSAGSSDRDLHAEDISFHRPRRPDFVVYPSRTSIASP